MIDLNKLDGSEPGRWTGTSAASRTYHDEAERYRPPKPLIAALKLAMQLHQPLLLTGSPGSGKTTAAYWVAWKLGLHPDAVVHIQVRSESLAQDLRYHYDAIEHFRRAQAQQNVPRREMLINGPLWQACNASQTGPVVVLFDEIDKAPRDFPNDLLYELDVYGFDVPERDGGPIAVRGKRENLVLVVFTSNAERTLPDAFLRRCLHHYIELDGDQRTAAVQAHVPGMPKDLIEAALDKVKLIKEKALSHQPGLAELIVWLKVLQMQEIGVADLKKSALASLPGLGALVKDPEDLRRL